ncbi:SLATT domain-containing protein [Nonomuraea fuscirosea]|uniref:SLATT domain-containing protein n=1 Tax=Nonomuraea fuscirosea TaxID=1291556 RepID=UPI0033D850D8
MAASHDLSPYLSELDTLYDDASYSAQSYFEAAKSAEFWGKAIVFLPAIASAIAALLVALDMPEQWGSVGAIAGAVAATASFLGSEKRASSYKETGRRFTELRHAARLERSLASNRQNEEEIEDKLRSLRQEYAAIVSTSELVGNRFFAKAKQRIDHGVLSYDKKPSKRTSSP